MLLLAGLGLLQCTLPTALATNYNYGTLTLDNSVFTLNSGDIFSATNVQVLGANSNASFVQNGGSATISNQLSLGLNATQLLTFPYAAFYSMSGGTLNTDSIAIGSNARGVFTQTGGLNYVTNGLGLGIYTASANSGAVFGQYTLSGGTLSTAVTNVGQGEYADAIFNQTGGVHTVRGTGNLTVGAVLGSIGTYSLSGSGVLSSGGDVLIGDSGNGRFNQGGGSFSAGRSLFVGTGSTSTGVYTLTAGTLNVAQNLAVGYNGNGTFSQSGGDLNAGSLLYVGYAAGSKGTFNFSGGTISAAEIYLGLHGSGTFIQSGGTISLPSAGVLVDGQNSLYRLDGGQLQTNQILVGYNGAASFVQSSGTATTPNFAVGNFNGSAGTYTISGGTLSFRAGGVGVEGNGTFIQTGGYVNPTATFPIGSGGLGGNINAAGYYSISNGTLTLGTEQIQVGVGAQGTLSQSGGVIQTSAVFLGVKPGAKGTYLMSGGSLNTSGVSVGYGSGGTGSFVQSGGVASIGLLEMAHTSGAASNYSLTGGTLSVTNCNIGLGGNATFSQSGGVAQVAGAFTLASAADTTAQIFLSNGSLNAAGSVIVGQNGAAAFNQSGGQSTTDVGFILGNNAGSSGVYSLNGGQLNTPNIQGNAGASTFNLNGGIISLRATAANFFGGVDAVNIMQGSGTFQTNGNAATISLGLIHKSASPTDGGLNKLGTGTLTFTGTDPNTYNGITNVVQGTLVLDKATATGAGTNAFGGPLWVGNFGSLTSSAAVLLNRDNELSSINSVLVSDNGLLSLMSHSTTIGAATMNGGVINVGNGNLTLSGDLTAYNNDTSATIGGTGNLNLNGTRNFNVYHSTAPITLIITDKLSNGALVKNGDGVLELSGVGSTAALTVNAGTLALGANGVAPNTGTITLSGGALIADGADVDYLGNLSVTQPSTIGASIYGGHSLTLDGNNYINSQLIISNPAGTTLANRVGAGSIVFAGGVGTLEAGGSAFTGQITVNAATVTLASTARLGSGTITVARNLTTNGRFVMAPGNAIAPRIAALNLLDAGPALDMNDNALVVAANTPTSVIRTYLGYGYDAGKWDGGGIISTTAGSQTRGLRGIGYMTGAEYSAIRTGLFRGSTFNATDTLLQYTYMGDTDFNNAVNIVDLGNLAAHWQQSGDWYNGDFNYDGKIDVVDLGILATNWQVGVTGMSFSDAMAEVGLSGASVPEPTALASVAIGLMLVRRRAA